MNKNWKQIIVNDPIAGIRAEMYQLQQRLESGKLVTAIVKPYVNGDEWFAIVSWGTTAAPVGPNPKQIDQRFKSLEDAQAWSETLVREVQPATRGQYAMKMKMEALLVA